MDQPNPMHGAYLGSPTAPLLCLCLLVLSLGLPRTTNQVFGCNSIRTEDFRHWQERLEHERCLEALLCCSNRHVPSLNLRQPSERAAQALNALYVQLRAAVQQKGR